MLRRTLLMHLAPLVAIFVIAAVASVYLLHGALYDLDHLTKDAQKSGVVEGGASASMSVAEDLRAGHEALTKRFRLLVLGLTVILLLVINVAVIVLLRTAGHILRPVDALVHATELLSRGHLGHRVSVPGNNEFAQLAGAFNTLAERLQLDERHKIEVLHQLALTLNHELNNCISIIDLQLRLLTRPRPGTVMPAGAPAGPCPAAEKSLREITENLRRMTRTVESLKHVRRIVLTDYIPGMKMLDLERSTREEEEPVSAGTGATVTAALAAGV